MTIGVANFGPLEIASWPAGMKRCIECGTIKRIDEFHVTRQCLFGVYSICKECRKPHAQALYKALSFERTLYQSAKGRAGRNGREFSISIEDIVIPAVCPVLCVPIERVRGSWYAPSIDRIDPDGGYTKDNILVMSKRANTLKNNMTYDEAMKLAFFLRQLT